MLLKYQLPSKSKAVVPPAPPPPPQKAVVPYPIETPGFLISMVQHEYGNLWLPVRYRPCSSGPNYFREENAEFQATAFFLIFEKHIEPVRLLENCVPKSGPSRK